MAKKSCVKRLQKEYRALCKEPVSHVVARPSPNDFLEWHYVLEESGGTPFAVISLINIFCAVTLHLISTVLSCLILYPIPTFRKLFHEYVDKYDKQQQQLVSQHLSPESPQGENPKPVAEKLFNSPGEEVKRVDTIRDTRRNRKQSFPVWIMLLLLSIFGIIMALPLLQLSYPEAHCRKILQNG